MNKSKEDRKLAGVVLWVSDLDRSESFYVDTLGASVERRRERETLLLLADDRLLLKQIDNPTAFREERTEPPRIHLRFVVRELRDWHNNLTDAGVEVSMEPETTAEGRKRFHVFDPDGHVLEFYA